MKKSITLIIFTLVSIAASSQETTKQKEIALSFSNFYDYGITYSFGNSNSLWRISTAYLGQQKTTTNYPTYDFENNHIGIGLSFGKEFRKPLTEKLLLRYGTEISFSFSNDHQIYQSNDNEQILYTPGIRLLGGFVYKLNDDFGVGALLLPFFSYKTGKSISNDVESDISGFDYGFSNSSAQVNLIFSF